MQESKEIIIVDYTGASINKLYFPEEKLESVYIMIEHQ